MAGKRNPYLHFTCFILLLLCLYSCNETVTNTSSNSAAVNKLFQDYHHQRLQLFPLEATAAGDTLYNNRLPLNSSAELQAQHSFLTDFLQKLQQINRNELDVNDALSFDILKEQLELGIAKEKFHPEYIPFTQLQGVPLTLMDWGSGKSTQPFNTVKDYDNWLQRIKAFPQWVDTAVALFNKGIAAKTVLPKTLVVKMMAQMKAAICTEAAKNIFYEPVTNFPAGFSMADKERLTAAYKNAIMQLLNPAYQKLVDYLSKEYLPKASASAGISAMPQGSDMYRLLIREFTTTNKTAEEIYAYGLSEVERITAEMEKVKTQTGFKGKLKDFFTYMDTAKKFMPFKTGEEVLNAYRKVDSVIQPQLKKYFNNFPKSGFDIKLAPAFMAAVGGPSYTQGSLDGSRRGVFQIPVKDAAKYNVTFGIEAVYLHEAVPGHHLQGAIQTENKLLPAFRRAIINNAYEEGWALYCESLGKQLGVYKDPYQYMAALGKEMHRAIRLVLDAGIHTKSMSREDAIKYMMEHEPISEQYAIAEVERYMAWPGQALGYKIGAAKIVELKNKYEKLLNDKFSIAAFHDELLKDGGMPLSVLEKKMDNWAAAVQSK